MSNARSALLALVVLGALTRLVGLSHPDEVVFDEVHWGTAVNAYCCSGTRIFDVHPPHGKLLITAGAVLAGYDGDVVFPTIGAPYGDAPVWAFRLVPALAGIAIAPLVFLLLRALGASVAAAWLAGLLLVFDNALVLETRTMLFDGILVASTLGALVCVLWADRVSATGRARGLRVAGGALVGLAVGTKITGLLAPGMIGLYLASRWWWGPRARRMSGWELAGMVAAAVAVYLAGWMIHFALLTQPGPADAFHPTTGRFVEDLLTTHTAMFEANARVVTPHPDMSRPLSWPLMRVAPYFWAGSSGALYLTGNPVVWWGSALMLVTIFVNAGLMRVTRLRLDPAPGRSLVLWLPAVAFVGAWVPYFFVHRVLFLYHYLTALVFAVTVAVLWLERAGWTRPDGQRQRASYWGVAAAAAIGFLLVSPVTYGFSAGGYDEWLVAVIRSWR